MIHRLDRQRFQFKHPNKLGDEYCGCLCVCGRYLPIHNLQVMKNYIVEEPKFECPLNWMMAHFLREGGIWKRGREFLLRGEDLYPAVCTALHMFGPEQAAIALVALTKRRKAHDSPAERLL